MSEKKYYLKQNVMIEPLVNEWYAWPHLISPATAAMNIANSHLNIMRSYLMSPEVHAAAVKNPAMRGGPFIDLENKRAGEIKTLLDRTLAEQAHMLEFAEALKALNELLLSEAKGYGLEELYAKVPEVLKGYVELVYDLNNNPSFRLIEGLLYRSPYYSRAAQSIALSLVSDDRRPFVFSTPRLKQEGRVHLRVPFDDPRIDELFRMREAPQSFEYVKALMGFGDEEDELFKTFLTEEKPATAPACGGDEPRVRYFGHACVLMETKGVSILTDPLLSYKFEGQSPRLTYADLPEVIDYVLITHSHSDHILLEPLLQLRHKIRIIVVPRSGGGSLEDPSLKLLLENVGFENVIEIDEMQSIPVAGGSITGLPFLGEHADLNIRSKTAYLVRLGGGSMLCAADSANLEPRLYERIHEVTGDVDTLFIGMECEGAPLTWVYGSLLTRPLNRRMDQSRRLSGSGYEKGIGLVSQFNCKQVYVYAMGEEPWLNHITSIIYTEQSKAIVESKKLVEECQRRGIVAEKLFGTKDIPPAVAAPAEAVLSAT
jgi:L-ascorbate metabolism protein UlaG (beta-lactamase superfamily)